MTIMRLIKEHVIEVLIIIGYVFHLFERMVAIMFSDDFNNSFLRSLYAYISRFIPLTTSLMALFSLLLIFKSIKHQNYVALIMSVITLVVFGKVLIDIFMSI